LHTENANSIWYHESLRSCPVEKKSKLLSHHTDDHLTSYVICFSFKFRSRHQRDSQRYPASAVPLRCVFYLYGFITTVALFRKPNAIPLCFSIALVLNFLLSWLPVLLLSTFFLDVLFSYKTA